MTDKQQYVSEVEAKMSDWDRRIEEIIQKSEESDKESILVKDLLEKQQEAKSRFEELQGADAGQFEDLKGRVSVATQALQDVLVRTSEEFQLSSPRSPSAPLPGQPDAGNERSQGGAASGAPFGGSPRRSVGDKEGSGRPNTYSREKESGGPRPGQSESSFSQRPETKEAGTEPAGEARPGEAQKRKTT